MELLKLLSGMLAAAFRIGERKSSAVEPGPPRPRPAPKPESRCRPSTRGTFGFGASSSFAAARARGHFVAHGTGHINGAPDPVDRRNVPVPLPAIRLDRPKRLGGFYESPPRKPKAERWTDPRLSHDFAVGDRVARRGKPDMGLGTVKAIPTPILVGWPEKVVVRWDKFGASFDGCCNSNPARDHMSPSSLVCRARPVVVSESGLTRIT